MERKTREKRKRKKRVEEISQDKRKKIRKEERRKIIKQMKREKHVSYNSHDSCNNLSEELSDYYRGHHSSYTKHHSQRRKMIEGLKRLTLASYISMEKIMLRPT